MPTWPLLLGRLLARESLSAQETGWAMSEILADNATQAQIAGFAIALRAKGETPEEIFGLAGAMLDMCAPLTLPAGRTVVDTCGTGGDGAHTVNISTMAALVVAGAGELVVKHGGRAATSSVGSGDVLEALGVAISAPAETVERCVAATGIAFCFAPVFHPAMRFAVGPRRELGVPTFFNVMGSLTNPARPGAQAVGVAVERLAPVVAGVLATRGTSALVLHGSDGLDEITLSGPTAVWEVRDGEISVETLTPALMGVAAAPVSDLAGGDAAFNANVARRVLGGSERGPIRDSVLVNAAAALVAAAPTADGSLADRMQAAVSRAAEAIDGGRASAALENWVAFA